MKSFLLALQFLTIIPIKIKRIDEGQLGRSSVYFPLIGLLLGLILSGAVYILRILNFQQLTSDIITVVLLIIFTGGLHLDGLSDTFDALSGKNEKEEIFKILRDPHIGVMGFLAILCIVLLKISLLNNLQFPLKIIAIMYMCLLSRWSLVLAMYLFPYARCEGKAKIFIQYMNFGIFLLSTLITLALVISGWQLKGVLCMAVVTISTALIGKLLTHKIQGITGDILGAINEISEVVVLSSMCVLSGVYL